MIMTIITSKYDLLWKSEFDNLIISMWVGIFGFIDTVSQVHVSKQSSLLCSKQHCSLDFVAGGDGGIKMATDQS